MRARQLHSGFLLQLPDQQLEQQFWSDQQTINAYTSWDTYLSWNQLIANVIIARSLHKALSDLSVLKDTWHMHVVFLVNILSTAINLVLVLRCTPFYKRNRHAIVMCQRLLRLLCMFLAVFQSSFGLQAAVARALDASTPALQPTLRATIMNLTRPLMVAPAIILAHGSWIFSIHSWLPLQVMTFALAVMGSARHQYCRMAADASSALLLQPTCQAVARVHGYLAQSIFGLLTINPSHISNPAACSSMAMAARTLGWYAHAAYGLLMPVAGFSTLEWRLKSSWVKKELDQDLVYGPFGWFRSSHERATYADTVQTFVSWVLAMVACFALTWVAVTWVVPQLPLMDCTTCQHRGTCQELKCEGVLCSIPGPWAAVVLHLVLLFILLGHLAVTRLQLL